jgi:hypothetical protein
MPRWITVALASTFLLAALVVPLVRAEASQGCVDGSGEPDAVGVAIDPTSGSWCLDGLHLNAGSRAHGLAMNVRAANALVDDAGPITADRWDYPGGEDNDVWDGVPEPGAARNAAEFSAALAAYGSFGLDMVTVGLQGGHPRFECLDATGSGRRDFSMYDDVTDGLSAAGRERLEAAVAAAWRAGIVVNVQLFYQNSDAREPNTDEEIVATLSNVTNELEAIATTPRPDAPDGYQNVVIELANEVVSADTYGSGAGGTTALDPVNLVARLRQVRTEWPQALVTVNLGTSVTTAALTPEENGAVQRELDWVSLHANTVSGSTLATRIVAARQDPDLTGKPVVVTEDRWSTIDSGDAAVVAPFDDGVGLNPNLEAAIGAGAGWGYYEQGCEDGPGASVAEYDDADPGEPARNHYRNGFQSPPVNWSPFSGDGAKLDFFTDVQEVTTPAAPDPSPSSDPSPSVDPSPSAEPSPTADPSVSTDPSPSVDPSPSTDPSSSVDPSPSAEPSPTADPSPSADPTPGPIVPDVRAVATYSSTADGAVHDVPGVEVTRGRMVLVAVASQARTTNTIVPSLEGLGLAWSHVDGTSVPNGKRAIRVDVFAVPATADAAGTLRVSLGTKRLEVHVAVAEAGDATVGASAVGSGSGSTAELTLGGATTSRTYVALAHGAADGTLPEAGGVELGDTSNTRPPSSLGTMWFPAAFEASPAATWSKSSAWCGVALELAAAA